MFIHSCYLYIIPFYAKAIYLMDKAYVDFAVLFRMHSAGAFFVTRVKENLRYSVIEQNFNINEATGLRVDKTIALTIANLYRNRWQIEVFFKWIKQNLTIKKLWRYSLKCTLSIYEICRFWAFLLLTKPQLGSYLPICKLKEQLNLFSNVC
jgi:hypothetical protein